MNIKNLFLSIALTFGVVSIYGQDAGKQIINDFFTNFENKGSDVAIDKLYATNPWTSRIQDAINNVKTQMARFNMELVGKYHGYEPIVTKKLGDSYILYSYFLKFDRQFLRLTFQFYKPSDEWRLYSFRFDDNFDEEIEQAAKLYYIDLD